MSDARTHSAPGDLLLLARLIQAVAQRLPERDEGGRLFGEPLADVLDQGTWTETRGSSSTPKDLN